MSVISCIILLYANLALVELYKVLRFNIELIEF